MRSLIVFRLLPPPFSRRAAAQSSSAIGIRCPPPPNRPHLPPVAKPDRFRLSVDQLRRWRPQRPIRPEHCHVFLMAQPEINIEVNLPDGLERPPLYVRQRRICGRVVRGAEPRGQPCAGAAHTDSPPPPPTRDTPPPPNPARASRANQQKLLDFGFRSLHVTAETAKLLVHAYYGSAPVEIVFRRLLARRPPGPDPRAAISRRTSTESSRDRRRWITPEHARARVLDAGSGRQPDSRRPN